MKYLIIIVRVNVFMAFLFHSFIVMTPAIDELGFMSIAIHVVLASVSFMLFNLSKDLE